MQEEVPKKPLFYFGIVGYIFVQAVDFLRVSLLMLEDTLLKLCVCLESSATGADPQTCALYSLGGHFDSRQAQQQLEFLFPFPVRETQSIGSKTTPWCEL